MYQYHLLVRELGNLVLESCVKLLVIMSALPITICLNANCSDINRGIQEYLWLWFYISWHKIETSVCLLWHKISWSTVKRKVKQLDKPDTQLSFKELIILKKEATVRKELSCSRSSVSIVVYGH